MVAFARIVEAQPVASMFVVFYSPLKQTMNDTAAERARCRLGQQYDNQRQEDQGEKTSKSNWTTINEVHNSSYHSPR